MNFWKRLNTDDEGKDKLEDKYALNTYQEIYLFWIGAMLTFLCFLIVANMILSWLGVQ